MLYINNINNINYLRFVYLCKLLLVLFGLRSVPKEDTRFSLSEAVFGSPLTVPGEFLEGGEFLPSKFLQRVEQICRSSTSSCFSCSACTSSSSPVSCKVFVLREDASVPPLAPLYFGPYLVLEQRTKSFPLQLGDRTDVVSVDRLKPAFSDEPISPALWPL